MQEFEALFRRFGRELDSGQVIYREGEPASEFFVVNSGLVRESRTLLGMEKLLREIGPGEFFGENALINGKQRTSTARTLAASRLLVIPTVTFQAMVRTNREIAVRILRRLAAHLDQLHEELGTLLYRDPHARLASFLAASSDAEGHGHELRGLSGTLGLRPGEAEDITQRFVRAGLVRLEAGHLFVADRAGLQDYLQYLRLKERFGEV